MSRYRFRYFQYYTRFVRPSADTSIIYEITIPSIVADEDGLKKLAEKRDLIILSQQREGASPPIVRILRKIEPYTTTEDADDFLKSLERSLKNSNIDLLAVHAAFILPLRFERENRIDAHGIKRFSITGNFVRKLEQTFELEKFLPSLASQGESSVSYVDAILHLYRDRIDPEDVWKIKISFRAMDQTILNGYFTEFIDNATKILSTTDFQYRASLA